MEEKKELYEQIKFMVDTEKEEFLRIANDSLEIYIKSVLTFGFNNISKECLRIIKDMFNIILKEKKLLNSINENINIIDEEFAWDVIFILDDLNESTYSEYEKILDNIDIACDTKNKNRIIKPNKPIDSLITNNEYEDLVQRLIGKKIEKKRN